METWLENTSTRPPQEVPGNRGGIFCMGAQTRTDILPYMSLIPVFGYFMRGTSTRIWVLALVCEGVSGRPTSKALVGTWWME